MSDTKLSAFLTENKLNQDRLLAVSHKLESLRPEDRVAKLAKRQKRGAEGGDAEKVEIAKPRSGRAVTPRALSAALTGGTISGPTKQRILRAVNYLLEQKKKTAVELKTLF
jgi:transposase